jgi:cytochrome oxidase Cu insertion factor (SCO1/SenC/PrrC family)
MRSKSKFCASIAAVLAIIFLSQTACDSGSNSVAVPKSDFTATGLRQGYFAPDIEGSDLEGKPMKLSDFRGKVVVLEFWSST